MKLSFDDEESFKEAATSLRFNNPPEERSEDIDIKIMDNVTEDDIR